MSLTYRRPGILSKKNRGRFSVVHLHNSEPGSGSLRKNPGAWQVVLLFGALPCWERDLEKDWSNPSFDHLQLRKRKGSLSFLFLRVVGHS